MNFLSAYGKEIVSLAVPLLTWILNSGLKAKAKLVWASPHFFHFLVQEPVNDPEGNVVSPTQRVCTASIKVINTGRETATKIELVFNWKPQYINLWPVRHYEHKTDQDGRHILIFDNLSPKEEIGIEIMCINRDLPELLLVRSAECIAKNVRLSWVGYSSPLKINIARALLLLGASTFIYLAIVLVQFLVLRTPA
ncbi:hypothetical protein [Pseudomonas salomonii]|uniref:Uncharacterized protein n=1 Tax=Pseudomonas salomonii TaxID=191391 RepID=A0ABS9GI20_9PSED|nr:hypothetical protein [Pseudomonas salomonii]MCF5544087.1 hypothetical protein [Pseudomonas salomonii]